MRRISAPAVPIVGAAQATALAGGFELLLSCDLIVAAEGANVGLPEVKRGLFAAGGGMFLARRIPLARALELTLTGDPISVDEALAMGLINRVVPASSVAAPSTFSIRRKYSTTLPKDQESSASSAHSS